MAETPNGLAGGQARACVEAISPYVPGKPAEEVAREYGIEEVVKLASNENPLGPSPRAIEALHEGIADLHVYPDGSGFHLKRAIGEHYDVRPEQVTLGNGSNDVLELVARAYLEPGVNAVFSQHAFAVYALATQAAGAEAKVVPARPADDPEMPFGADLEAMAAAVDEQTRVVFLANPNNPTGTWVESAQLRALLDAVPPEVIVVLDEAYTEYVDDPAFPDGLELLAHYPNLVVTRTFSKIFGLAALRVGFAVSDPAIASLLDRVRHPFNVNALALRAAEAALDDGQFIAESRAVNRIGLAQWQRAAEARDWQTVPSRANFITVITPFAAGRVFEALLREGVIVRPLGGMEACGGLSQALRITIGTEAQNARAIEALERVLQRLVGEGASA
ncbi:histidinol-phosphate transaminase [Guyparkeria hydrothermalis]|uniref:histidinol-phosphate transaminase n=1 Tax=Guyparkeria hydrothermalis TaxID=923 RepID=UPI002020BC4A|nr:histidinol-phosphate transaminase [Guyparkeria hydrothermalis]MCL7744342.1 histidinol-phosphate transaminase [Guyparkeria hydrothermalis]